MTQLRVTANSDFPLEIDAQRDRLWWPRKGQLDAFMDHSIHLGEEKQDSQRTPLRIHYSTPAWGQLDIRFC